ncbi:aldo/keto reductase [Streptomyces sp. NPDC059009]|uniref:aldo/keto reductase n=1 Tax=Streptomyces sp. NPDC059009 TaxID=3346694 RepID=UPI00368D94F1
MIVETCPRGHGFSLRRPSSVCWRRGAHAQAGGEVAAVAEELGATTAQVSLAWLLRRSATALPIPGTTSVAHLEENVGALGLRLSDGQYERLSKVAQPEA